MDNIQEYIQAMILGGFGGLAKAILTYIIDKKISAKHSIALVVLGSIISLGLVPLSGYITQDVNVRVAIGIWGGLLASTLIRFIEDKLPSILSILISRKEGT